MRFSPANRSRLLSSSRSRAGYRSGPNAVGDRRSGFAQPFDGPEKRFGGAAFGEYLSAMKLLPFVLVFFAMPLAAENLVLADFPSGLYQTAGWRWVAFTDRVMGGRSDLDSPVLVRTSEGDALRLAGTVVTRGGGFIQARLEHEKGPFDGSVYRGVEVTLGAPPGGSYYVFVRTRDNALPWSYYRAPVHTVGDRISSAGIIRVPWEDFQGVSTRASRLRPQSLTSIALVAGFADFDSDLNIYRVALYR